jgi:1-acyl-sn-glycerol-3-phosphate acyltransferase
MFHKPKRRYLAGFVPPRPSRTVIWACKRLIDFVLENQYQVTGVSVRPEEMERFRRFRGQRMVLVPNHPTNGDPAVLFKVSKLAHEDWFYLSNREQFDRGLGLYGRLLQRVGAYSIARGTMDKQSFLTTKSLLANGGEKLVVFAEGGAYSWNDLEAPFQEGLFKLVLNAAVDMRDKGIDEPLWVQPVAIKYVFDESAERMLERSLESLEAAVGLSGPVPEDFRERLLRIGTAVVGVVEVSFFGKKFSNEGFHERVSRVREEMLERFAHALSVPVPAEGSLLERTRVLFDSFHRVSLEGVLPETDYEEMLFEEDIRAMRSVRRQLDRLENWMALKEGYLAESGSLSRKVEIVTRLEREVYRSVQLRAPRKAVVRLGEPFDIRQFVPAEGRVARDAAEFATLKAEESVREMLHEMRL